MSFAVSEVSVCVRVCVCEQGCFYPEKESSVTFWVFKVSDTTNEKQRSRDVCRAENEQVISFMPSDLNKHYSCFYSKQEH